LVAEMKITIMQFKKSRSNGTRKSHKSFYPDSLFHKSYV